MTEKYESFLECPLVRIYQKICPNNVKALIITPDEFTLQRTLKGGEKTILKRKRTKNPISQYENY